MHLKNAKAKYTAESYSFLDLDLDHIPLRFRKLFLKYNKNHDN